MSGYQTGSHHQHHYTILLRLIQARFVDADLCIWAAVVTSQHSYRILPRLLRCVKFDSTSQDNATIMSELRLTLHHPSDLSLPSPTRLLAVNSRYSEVTHHIN